MAKAIMIQGTGSHVGKSVLTAALCRIFREDGLDVAPFKSQNMALNSFITEEGEEMGRAQVAQAEAAGLKPHIDMNPILIKPHSDTGAQVIIQGRVFGNYTAGRFHNFKATGMRYAEESYRRLALRHDLIVIEGAGSPAEVNLRDNDIANMGTAHMADAPVILVGDIDKGGVFASLVGTLELLDEADRSRIRGFIINKFRGDLSLLSPGLDFLEQRTGLPVLGVIPWFRDIYIQEEDSVNLERRANKSSSADIEIAVLYLPHISNFTDFDPFEIEPGVNLRYVRTGEKIGEADLVIIPGSKNTLFDLRHIIDRGYAEEIRRHVSSGGRLIGICGGYQMMGKHISDLNGIEEGGSIEGLGYLDIRTVLQREKRTAQVEAGHALESPLSAREDTLKGYEVHMGESFYIGGARPIFNIRRLDDRETMECDGAESGDGRIWGTYIHGIFDNDAFRKELVAELASEKGVELKMTGGGSFTTGHDARKEEGYRRLAEIVRENLDMGGVYRIAGIVAPPACTMGA